MRAVSNETARASRTATVLVFISSRARRFREKKADARAAGAVGAPVVVETPLFGASVC